MAKYLYGAAVQGIQGFIFQTNKLREIAGASELVKEICDAFFIEKLNEWKISMVEKNFLVGAAGNIKYVFDSREDCEKVVRFFPKAVMELADGITISQAVVEVGKFDDDIEELEKRLRIQRNKAISIQDTAGLMVTETARRTGGVGYDFKNNEVIDLGQSQKLRASNTANARLTTDILTNNRFRAAQFPFDISDMVKKEENRSWIAVIHIDGNSLGKKLIKMGKAIKGDAARDAFRDFSKKLDQSTKEAIKSAFNKTIGHVIEREKLQRIPFRPVVLGGDDLTAIVRGDLALDFTHCYLDEFERITKSNFKDFDTVHGIGTALFSNGLTACAGIAFIKANYPFHYGVKLAENLCQYAKGISKKIDQEHSPSSLMFHKVHASFVEEFEDIIDKELNGARDVFFNYGPYFIHEQDEFDTIETLKTRITDLNRKDAPKSGLRNWLNELQHSPDMAKQTLERIATLNDRYTNKLCIQKPFKERVIKYKGKEMTGNFTPIFDAMVLSNILTENENE